MADFNTKLTLSYTPHGGPQQLRTIVLYGEMPADDYLRVAAILADRGGFVPHELKLPSVHTKLLQQEGFPDPQMDHGLTTILELDQDGEGFQPNVMKQYTREPANALLEASEFLEALRDSKCDAEAEMQRIKGIARSMRMREQEDLYGCARMSAPAFA